MLIIPRETPRKELKKSAVDEVSVSALRCRRWAWLWRSLLYEKLRGAVLLL